MRRTQFTVLERLQRLCIPEPNTGCWLWLGITREGYGRIRLGGRLNGHWGSAHRLMYELLKGPIPEGLELDHKCKLTCCVNPQHLEPVTHAVNVQRGDGGKRQAVKTHCPYGHPYDAENTRIIVRPTQPINRVCKKCSRISTRKRYYAIRGREVPHVA